MADGNANDPKGDLETYAKYMNDGYQRPIGDSSMLISSSPYLNDPILREHIARQSLRRNGLDLPTTYNYPVMVSAVEAAQDQEHINALFAKARRAWPELDAWMGERRLTRWKRADLASCKPGTLGHRVFEHFDEYGLENAMSSVAFPCENDYQFFRRRKVEMHDFMHVLTGAGFDYIGEFLVNFVNYGSFFKFFEPELAKEILVQNTLNIFPFLTRVSLHYPMGFPYVWEMIEQGVKVGRESGPWFMKRVEDYIHLSVAEAREAMGICGAFDPDLEESFRRSDHIMEGGQTKMRDTAKLRRERLVELDLATA